MHVRWFALLLPASLFVLFPVSHAQLREQIARIASQAQGRVGVACSLPGKALDCGYHADEPLPMQSVYKLPISMAMLHAVEQGRFTLDQKLHFVPSKMIGPTEYSPLRDEHPHGAVDDSIEDLIHRAATQSDNVAADVVLRAAGGPAAVTAYMRSLGISGIVIRDPEGRMTRDERLQYRNTAEARSLAVLLRILADRSPLTPEDTQMLLRFMTETHSADHRLRALLPPGTPSADKTGTAGQNRITVNATNDIALVTLPDGRRLAIAVLITDAKTPFAVREQVIAQVGQAIYAAAIAH